ncbi:hypothetical protein HDU91_000873 [Kappamyces sp. JEL0680]|nr:hypothetical protein HDU91_000873 [Kappamyces sp. JEL0680]
MFAAVFLALPSLAQVAQQPSYPAGCDGPTFPDSSVCAAQFYDLGAGAVVYIQDPLNFCINLPDPNSKQLNMLYYSFNKYPTIVAGEGYVQSFCTGSYFTPGALPLPAGGIRSAHVIRAVSPNGKKYYEISGTLDCNALHINCTASAPDTYDDGGQYDSVSYRYCGKEPYSGVDSTKHPGMVDYVEQAGNGMFCMRVCEAGQELTDPCNVKDDTKGCQYTMGVTFRDGFTYTDKTNGSAVTTYTVSLPPLASSTTSSAQATTTLGATGSGGSTTGSSSKSGDLAASRGLIEVVAAALFGLLI